MAQEESCKINGFRDLERLNRPGGCYTSNFILYPSGFIIVYIIRKAGFPPCGFSPGKKGLNRYISDASWAQLILKIEYLAGKPVKIVIKVNPKHSSQECGKCGHIDRSNRHG